MGKKYPEAQKLLDMIAEKNAISRIELGVHFMSDIKAGREMADKMIEIYEDKNIYFYCKNYLDTIYNDANSRRQTLQEEE